MIAASAGGRIAAICRVLIPPQDRPRIPILPLHHVCAASQAMIAQPILKLERRIFVGEHAFGVAAAAHIDPGVGDAVAGQGGTPDVVVESVGVLLAVGDVFEDRQDRLVRGGFGSQSREAERRDAVGHGDPGADGVPGRPHGRKTPGLAHPAARRGRPAGRAATSRVPSASRRRRQPEADPASACSDRRSCSGHRPPGRAPRGRWPRRGRSRRWTWSPPSDSSG